MELLCTRQGCSGKIVDGFCENCGRPPLGQSAGVAGKAGAAGTQASAVSTPSRSVSSLSGRSGSGRTGRSSRSGRSSQRHALGAGLVALPPLPSMDPLQSILANPVVPENKRFCGACGSRLSREAGFCPNCGQEYSLIPTLKAGDLVGGQYEVKGPIAFGGLGWIYLAWDRPLSRWVVLKGLLNSKDEASAAAALAERQFLAAVKHPKIVGIYNFVSRDREGYIVMEYVGGKTLKALRQERGPLPVAEAIAYIYGILPSFAYLERMGLVYCDFKPDNCMLEGDDVKLIDMGGVRRIDDQDSDVYGTAGYTAPEGNQAPSFVSDLYTVARTLAVLIIDFKFQSTFLHTLPAPDEQPLFARYSSLYRWLLRGTHARPEERFQTADEMAEQLLGVLREVVAADGTPRFLESVHFTGDRLSLTGGGADPALQPDFSALPDLRVDSQDPAANLVLSAGMLGVPVRRTLFERAIAQFPESTEAPLRLAALEIESGDFSAAEKRLAAVGAADPYDWRVFWYRGCAQLARKRPQDAQALFDRVYSELPGELAPKLALGLAAEMAGDLPAAASLYELVSRADPTFVSATFGVARCRTRARDRDGAAAAYDRIPASSSLYAQAQMALARVLLQAEPSQPGEAELLRAASAVETLAREGYAQHRLAADLLLKAVELVETSVVAARDSVRVLGQPLRSAALRAGAERELRACARYAASIDERFALVDHANAVRPRTLF